MTIIVRVGCALAATLIASPVLAEAEGAESIIVVTGQRLEQALARPGGTDLVAADAFENRLAVSLRDTLAFSPGVYTQPRFGQEVRLSIRGSGISRGYHMRGLTLLQDGIPINLADDNGDFQELDPLVFQHIEVYRGANALRFGGSTLGGAINAVTPTGRSAGGLTARLDGGSFDTLRGQIAYGHADGAGDVWLSLTGDTSDGDRDHAKRHSLRFNGNAGLRLSQIAETRFYASVNHIVQALPGALTLGRALAAPESGNFGGDQHRDIDSLRLQNRTTVTIGKAVVEAGLFLNAKQLFHPIYQVVDQDSVDYGAFARLDWADGPIELSLGGTARFGRIDSRRFVNANGARGALTFDADQKAHTVSLYGETRYRPIPALALIAGAVFTDGARRQDQIVPARIAGRADFTEVSPKFGLIFEPRTNLEIYANYSRSHELPGFGELAQVAAFVPLEAQRGWTAEAGARGRIDVATFDVSFYRADLKGEMLQFTVGADIPASTFNARDTRHQGIEAGLDLSLAPWARLRQIYQYSDFRFRGDARYGDNRLPVVPRHLYRAELRLGGERASIAPNLEWVPEGAWADYFNTRRVGGYALIGLTAEAKVARKISLFLDARNVAGRKAAGDISAVVRYIADNPATPADDSSAIFYPVERRAVYGGVRARF